MTSEETINQRFEETIHIIEETGNDLSIARVKKVKTGIDEQNSLCKDEHDSILQDLKVRYDRKQEQLREWKKEQDRKIKEKLRTITAKRADKIRNLKIDFIIHNRQAETN